MKSRHVSFALVIATMFLAAGASALGTDDNNQNAKPSFGDPGGQNPERLVSEQGGTPYYQPASYEPASASQIVSAYHQDSRTK